MGNVKSLESDVQKNKRLASNAHAELLEAVYGHPYVLIDFVRGEMKLPRPTLDPAAAQSKLAEAYQRRIERLERLRENEKLEDLDKALEDKIVEISTTSIPDVFKAQWTALQERHRALCSRGATHTVTLQPQFENLLVGRSKKGTHVFVDALIEETYCEEFRIEDGVRFPVMESFTFGSSFRSIEDTEADRAEAHRSEVREEIDHSLPTVEWVTSPFYAWVEIRPDEVGVGSLIADLRAIMDLDLAECLGRDRDCMLCIGPTRTPIQAEMLRTAGVLYLGRDRLFELIRSASPP